MHLLDSDVLIQAKNAHYAFDLVPGFWTWLIDCHGLGRVFIPDAVVEEINRGSDELTNWLSEIPLEMTIEFDATKDLAALTSVTKWAQASQFKPAAISKFLGCADFRIVAFGLSRRLTVVTMEVSAPKAMKDIKLPDACKAMDVKCVNIYSLMRAEGISFR